MNIKLIQVLVDNESWILPYAERLLVQLRKQGYQTQLCRTLAEIKEGWTLLLLGCVNIVPQQTLSLNKFNLVIHESALPQGKGFAPMSWQILAGCNKIPISLINADKDADCGDIWLEDSIQLQGHELHDEWRDLQGKKSIELFIRFINEYKEITVKKQRGPESFYQKRTPKNTQLDIELSKKQQFDLLRVVDNKHYPAFFEHLGQKYKLTISKYE